MAFASMPQRHGLGALQWVWLMAAIVVGWFGTRLGTKTKMEFLCGNSPSKRVEHRLDGE